MNNNTSVNEWVNELITLWNMFRFLGLFVKILSICSKYSTFSYLAFLFWSFISPSRDKKLTLSWAVSSILDRMQMTRTDMSKKLRLLTVIDKPCCIIQSKLNTSFTGKRVRISLRKDGFSETDVGPFFCDKKAKTCFKKWRLSGQPSRLSGLSKPSRGLSFGRDHWSWQLIFFRHLQVNTCP